MKLSILVLSMEVPHCEQLHEDVAPSAGPLGNITPAVALSMSETDPPVLSEEFEASVALQLWHQTAEA